VVTVSLHFFKDFKDSPNYKDGVFFMQLKLTFYDKFFIVLLLLLSLSGFVLNFTLDAAREQKYITVHVDHEFIIELSFNDETEKTVTFPFGENKEHVAVLEISQGRIRLLPINKDLCPQGICAHTGWISRNYQSIVCVPNRIVVSFSDKKLDGVDGVTH
jgi:hypothetical protein